MKLGQCPILRPRREFSDGISIGANIMTTQLTESSAVGFLTDTQILGYLNRGLLISPRTWIPGGIRHASYTMRVGTRVEVARANKANVEDRRDFVVFDLNDGESFELNPGDTVKLFSLEHFQIPSDILAFTIARGLLFSESLVPENTYADPGFVGPLYTTVTNLSHRIVKIYIGDPIARIFFFRLSAAVEEPFAQGSSKGIKQRLESSRATKIGTAEECKSANTDQIVDQLQHMPIGGTQVAELWYRTRSDIVGLTVFSICWPLFLLFANLNVRFKAACGVVLSNILAAGLSAALSYLGPIIYRKARRV
jgi:deoxycytidine triphosphate deaminase